MTTATAEMVAFLSATRQGASAVSTCAKDGSAYIQPTTYSMPEPLEPKWLQILERWQRSYAGKHALMEMLSPRQLSQTDADFSTSTSCCKPKMKVW